MFFNGQVSVLQAVRIPINIPVLFCTAVLYYDCTICFAQINGYKKHILAVIAAQGGHRKDHILLTPTNVLLWIIFLKN